MKTTQFIIVKQKKTRYGYKSYSSRLTQGSPALAADEVAVKVTLEIPDAAFEKPAFEAKIFVPDEAVSAPVIEAQVIDNVREMIKQGTGFDVRLEVVDRDADA